MRSVAGLCCLALVVGVAPSVVFAEQAARSSSQPQREGTRAERAVPPDERSASGRWRRVGGTVERVKRVSLRGVEGDHLVALITGDEGQRLVVDLGPSAAYREAPIMSGDRLTVRGPLAWVSGRKVLFAQQVNVNGERIHVARERAIDGRQLDRRVQRGEETPISGRIERSRELRLHGIDRRHVVVQLKTDDGRQLLADLGSPQDVQPLALGEGRSITVQGLTIRVSGKPLVLARYVTADGKRVGIDRDVQSILSAKQAGRAKEQTITGRTVLLGQLLKTDDDGLYLLRDSSGRETYLAVTPDIERRGFRVGDQIKAEVDPAGQILSMEKAEPPQ